MATDPIMPNPQVYPKCGAPDCNRPYVLRRGIVLKGPSWVEEWVWARDCKHKKAAAKMVDLRRRKDKQPTRSARSARSHG